MWEKHQSVASHICTLSGDQTCNPGMCPDRELNWRPFALRDDAQPSHTSQGCSCFFMFVLQVAYNCHKKKDPVFCSKTVLDHWASPSKSSLGDDVVITSPYWGVMLSCEKPLAKQSLICLIPVLLLHDPGLQLPSGSSGHSWCAFLQPFLWRTSYSS